MKKKRRLLFLMSIVLGGFLGMFVGMFKARVESHEIILDVKALIPWISAVCLLIGFISMFLTFNFLKKSRKFHSLYQEEMDDDLNETYYVQMYRNLEFGTIAFNITGVAIPLAIFISLSEVIILHTNPQTFFLSFLLFVVFLVAQKSLFKTIAIVRQFDLEFFATPKDVLNYINSYDEGERQANLEQSFRILFQLHQYVLPALYIFLIIISFLTGEIQLLAFLLVGAIHVYINVMQLPDAVTYGKTLFQIKELSMKLLKNLGWILLALLSFLFIYGFIQGLATASLALGASPYAVTLLYVALAGVYVYGIYKWYQKAPVHIEKSGFNRFIWLPALVWFLSLVVQFFLPDDPSVNQQIATDLTLSQPLFSFFAVVIFAPLTEEIVFRGMLARYLFPKQDNSKRTLIFLLVSSLLFALIHFPGDVQQFFVYFSLGFSLGLAYISRKGLVYSISLHALNNLVGFLMILML